VAFLPHFRKNQCRERKPQVKQHVATNYCDARSLIAAIDRDRGSVRPHIEAYLSQSDTYWKAAS